MGRDKKKLIATVVSRSAPFTIDHAEGSWLYTTAGEKWLDFATGIAVANTGHCHPKVVAAAQEQCGKIIHAQANMFYHQPMLDLAEKLVDIVPGDFDNVLFCNSGAEAVENAVKLAKQSTRRPGTIAFQGAFHGRTHLTMALTCSKTIYRGHFEPLPSAIYHAPFAYPFRTPASEDPVDYALSGLDRVLAAEIFPNDVACILVEPIQGEGGFIVPPKEFMQGLRAKADEIGAMLILDEIQAGMGRTGKWFCHEHYGITADIVTVAKGIASGFPLSAVVSREEYFSKCLVGSLGGTYGGNAVACAAAIASIDALRDDGMLANATRQGEKLRGFFSGLQKKYPAIGEVRGLGLMDAIEIVEPGTRKPAPAAMKKFVAESMARNVLTLGAGMYDNVVRFLPALNIDDAAMAHALGVYEEAAAAAF